MAREQSSRQDELHPTLFRLTQATQAIFIVIWKWLVGVAIYKLINLSFTNSNEDGQVREPSQVLLRFVFLIDLTFYQVVGMAIAANVVLVTTGAFITKWAARRSALMGRRLRSEVLEKAVTESGGTDGAEIHHTANKLIVKIKLLEEFQEFEDHWILIDGMIIVVGFLAAIVFIWYAGLTALAVFATSTCIAMIFETMRKKPMQTIETNASQVNARLLDIIKNGRKIKIMGQLDNERTHLRLLEEESDEARAQDATLKFYRDLLKHLVLGMLPIAMVLVGWAIISNTTPQDAVDIGSSILVTTLLADEAHKSLIHLMFVLDKKVGADEAQAAVDRFLDKQPQPATPGKDSPHHCRKETTCTDSDHLDTQASQGDLESGHGSTDNAAQAWIRKAVPDTNELVLQQVVLHYPDREQPALDHYNQSFQRGKVHALVGESGSGKSTALKVIADLVHPSQGSMECWEGTTIAFVSQDQKLFARSIRENIVYGANRHIPDREIWAALKAATIDEWVLSLPDGLDQLLVDGEGGVSGGQLQRLNLAHLFCTCQQADLVILDEVLSALDQTSREALLDQLDKFLQDKTAIVVTHHSEMLRICHEVHQMPQSAIHLGFTASTRSVETSSPPPSPTNQSPHLIADQENELTVTV